MAEQSILSSVKKVLGISEEYMVFDEDIILHINSVFSTLQQLGVGPVEGFEIEDKEMFWSSYVTDPTMNIVKTYMYDMVRVRFDPPTTGHANSAIQDRIKESEWRLNVFAERNGRYE